MREARGQVVASSREGVVNDHGTESSMGAVVGMILALVAGCAGFLREQKAYAPHINPADFTTIDNEYFSLKPGTTFVYQGNRLGTTRDEMAVTSGTNSTFHSSWARGR